MKAKNFIVAVITAFLMATLFCGLASAAEVTQPIAIKQENDIPKISDFQTGYVKAYSGVKVRKQPNKDGKVIKKFVFRDKIKYAKLDNNKNWVMVKYTNNKGETKIGYVSKKFVSKKKPKPASYSKKVYTPSTFKSRGRISWGKWRYTWYSLHESGQTVTARHIPGKHVNSDGYVCDKDGYICVANNSLAFGAVIDTPFGAKGKVYDRGTSGNLIDVYTNF